MSSIQPNQNDQIDRAIANASKFEQSLDSISLIKSQENLVFDNNKVQFAVQSVLGKMNPFDKTTKFQRTLSGIQALKSESNKILPQLQAALKQTLIPADKREILNQKITSIQSKISQTENEFLLLQKTYMNDPSKYAKLSESVRNLRFALVDNLKRIQKARSQVLEIHRPFPFDDSQQLDKLPKEVLQSYAVDLAEEDKMRGRDSEFLKRANDFFYLHKTETEEKAMKLHDAFKKSHKGEEMPVAESTNTVMCASQQLKDGIKILRENFPGLTTCAQTPEQKAYVAKMLQIILTGKALEPQNDACFRLRELQGASSQGLQVDKPKNESTVLNQLISFNPSQTIRDNLNDSVKAFTDDCIKRTGFIFESEGTKIPLGPNNDPIFFKKMNESYTKFLSDNPEKVKDIVQKNRNSDFFRTLKTLGFPYEDGADKSVFPQAVLSAILSQHMETLQSSITEEGAERHLKKLEEMITHTSIDPKIVEDIATKSGCDPKEIEPLVRMKAVEMMAMMNQSIVKPVTAPVVQSQLAFQNPINPDAGGVVPPQVANTIFRFDQSFESLTFEPTWKLSLTAPHFQAENVTQEIEDAPVVASVKSVVEMPSFTTTDGTIKQTPMADPLFSWNITSSYLDYLTTVIKPELMEQELDNLNAQMHDIQKLSTPSSLTRENLQFIYTLINQSYRRFVIYASATKFDSPEKVREQGMKIRTNIEVTALALERLSSRITEGNTKKAVQQIVDNANDIMEKLNLIP